MPKASPAKLNFNAGEFAITVEGRTDLDRYPASMRVMRNAIAAPQGPCIRRSGTYYIGNAYRHDMFSGIISFVFSDEQAQVLEFGHNRLKFITEDGFQVYTPAALTAVVTTAPFKFTSSALNASVGDEVIFAGFANNLNVNGEVAKITAKAGNDYTVDIAFGGVIGATIGTTVSRLYHIATPYLQSDVRNVVAVQSIDVLYLFCKGYRTRTLSRYGAYDWRLELMQFTDGPFDIDDPDIGVLTPSTRAWATGIHSSNTAAVPDTGDVSSNGTSDGHPAWYAFDAENETYFETQENQSGILTYSFSTPKIIEGYVIHAARRSNSETNDSAKDNAPATWKFQARQGFNWITLDERIEYPSYKNGRTQYIKINNKASYSDYRLNVTGCINAGSNRVRIGSFIMRQAGDVLVNFTLDNTARVNKGQGFLSTDVGRLIRIYQGDGFWRTLEITTVTNSTTITAKLQGEPLYDTSPIRRWRLGAVSDTTGWPTVGGFYGDRLCIGGMSEYPTMVALSRVGLYTAFSPTDPDGSVIDDNGMTLRLNTRRASPVRWLVGDQRGLLIGMGDSEWVLRPDASNQPFSARNVRADRMTARGSAAIVPAEIDKQVIFVHSSRRTVREYAYSYESDGFKSPSMSLFAPHLGVPLFAQLAYAAEPHSIVWFRRDDGSVVAMTYQRDENVVGWHRHDFGGVVESVTVVPSTVDAQDTLWMVIRRTINGQTRRYIERLMRFWDFDSTLEQSHFVDCGLRLENPTLNTVFGLNHLEGQRVCGLMNNVPFGVAEDIIVANGSITVPLEVTPGSYIVVGLAYESYAETNRIEAGAGDGTAQGKTKRVHNVVPFLWQSAYGEVGVYNEDQKQDEFEAIEYDTDDGVELEGQTVLFDGMLDPKTLPPGYGKRGSLIFRQRWPLPFNVIALMPQLHTQDR